MRILAIVTTPFYQEKGSSMRVHATLTHVSSRYFVDVVTYPVGRDPGIPGVTVNRVGKTPANSLKVGKPSILRLMIDLQVLLQVIRQCWNIRYKVIHCEDFEALCVGWVAKFIRPQARLVYDMHNPVGANLQLQRTNSLVVWLADMVERTVRGNVDRVIYNWRIWAERTSFRHLPGFLAYDSVTLDKDPISLPDLPYIAYSGNFEPYQGIEDFIWFFLSTDSPFKLVLVGNAPDSLTQRIERADSSGRTLFLGVRTVQQTNTVLANASFSVVPRLAGPTMKIVHSLVCSTPVIARNNYENRELLEHGHNAFLYDTLDDVRSLLDHTQKATETRFELEPGVSETREGIMRTWTKDYFMSNYDTVLL